MNASNHSRRAVSSLTREEKGTVLAIAAKDKLQFLIRVLVRCSGQVQGRDADLASSANHISLFMLRSRDSKPIDS